MTPEEKAKAMPIEQRVAVLDNIERQVDLHNKQNALLNEMKAALMSLWERNGPLAGGEATRDAVDMLVQLKGGPNAIERPFVRALKAYHFAVENDEDEVTVMGRGPLPVAYVKHMLEWVEPVIRRQVDSPAVPAMIDNIKRQHTRRMKEKTLCSSPSIS